MRNTGITDFESLFNLRVLLRNDKKYGVHVAHCIETGNVVTADSEEDAKEMMKELLEDEISFAIRYLNLKNLFSSPAPLEVHLEWMKAAQMEDPKIEFLDVDLRHVETKQIDTKSAHLQNRVQFAKATGPAAEKEGQ